MSSFKSLWSKSDIGTVHYKSARFVFIETAMSNKIGRRNMANDVDLI